MSQQTAVIRPAVRPTTAMRVRRINEVAAQIFPAVIIAVLVLLIIITAQQSGVAVAGEQLLNGLTIGGVYALIAVGYTMVYGIIELINFAHGDVFTLSAFYSVLVVRYSSALGFDLNSLAVNHGVGGFVLAMAIVLPITMLLAGLTGVTIERVAYRRLRNAPKLAPLITAVGVSFFLEGLMQARAGSANVPTGMRDWVRGDAFTIGGVTVTWKDIFVVGSAVFAMVLLQTFVRRTRLGKAMRATAQERDASLLSGININRTIAATFFIGSAMAAVGGVVYSIKEGEITWNLGFQFGIIAFTSAVLGGIGNIVGAGLGGFLIGLFAVFGSQLIGAQWANSIIFIMLIIVLTFRPVGLLGQRLPDRA
ncbi:MAG TPA: branched-chain amino acid ABC transporter permease [Candidatus Dormibacteraeota bacterium]